MARAELAGPGIELAGKRQAWPFAAMPIRREHRYFYSIDWPQLSALIRFGGAEGRCEACWRLHGETVFHLT